MPHHPSTTARRAAASLACLGLLAALAAGCGGEEETPSDDASATPTTVEITFQDGSVTPQGDRVSATVGQPVTLEIHADEPGELHIHSRPEQEIEYAAGDSEHELTIATPGTVEVESHDLDVVIVQLQVNPE